MADSSSYCSKRPQADVSHRDPNPAPPDSCPHGEPDRAAEHGQIPASFRVLPHKHSHLRMQVLTADQLRWWTATKKTAKQKTANGVGLEELVRWLQDITKNTQSRVLLKVLPGEGGESVYANHSVLGG